MIVSLFLLNKSWVVSCHCILDKFCMTYMNSWKFIALKKTALMQVEVGIANFKKLVIVIVAYILMSKV